ncbi:MAG: rod shape-determining protein MreD [Patescibacteria group bacterium]|nr:rod shape-determining protein MreD [Patescibacteria group bacterium]
MKKIYKLFALVFAFSLVDVGVFPVLFKYYPAPSLVFSFCVALASKRWGAEALWVAFVGGLFMDLMVWRPLGLTSLCFLIFSWGLLQLYRVVGFNFVLFAFTSLVLSFLFRFVFGSFQLSWIYLVGAFGDLVLSFLFVIVFLPILKPMVLAREKQLDFYQYL